MIDVGLDVLGSLRQAGQGIGPEVDARIQVFAKAPLRHVHAQVAVGTGDQLEIAAGLAVAAHGQEALFFNSLEQHGLFVQAQFADLVQEQHALVGGAQQAGPVSGRAGEGAFLVAEQGRGGAVAAQRGAIDLDELALT